MISSQGQIDGSAGKALIPVHGSNLRDTFGSLLVAEGVSSVQGVYSMSQDNFDSSVDEIKVESVEDFLLRGGKITKLKSPEFESIKRQAMRFKNKRYAVSKG